MTGFALTRSPAGVVLHVDGHPVTGVVSEEQAIAAVLRLTAEAGQGWRGAFVWPDTADGSERVLERMGGPRTSAEARAASDAVRREIEGPRHTSGYARVITREKA